MITQPTKKTINGDLTVTKLHQPSIHMTYLPTVKQITNTKMMKLMLRIIILKVIINIQDIKIRNHIAIKIIKNMLKIIAMQLYIEHIFEISCAY